MIKAGLTLFIFIGAKIGAGFIMLKALTVLLPVDGFGRVSQIMAFITIQAAIAGGGQNRSLTVNLAALAESPAERTRHLRVAVFYFLVATALSAIFLGVFGDAVIARIAPGNAYGSMALAIFVGVLFSGVNNLQTSVIVAAGKLRDMTWAQSLAIIWATAAMIFATYLYGDEGAILGFAAFGFWLAAGNALVIRRHGLLARDDLAPMFDGPVLRKIVLESLAFIIYISALPLAQTWGRQFVGATAGWRLVGQMQALNRLSDAVQQVFGHFFNSYVLVYFAASTSLVADRKKVVGLIGFIGVSSVLILATIFVLRYLVVFVVYTPEYYPIADVMDFQFVGDFFRIFSMMVMSILLAKSFTRLFTVLEIANAAVFMALLWAVSGGFSLSTISGAYMTGHAVMLVVVATAAALMMRRQAENQQP